MHTPLPGIAAAMLLAATALLPAPAQAGETPSVPGARVYFIQPVDGDTVKSPVLVVFGLSGMGVAPAGVEKENTGHHHLIVNAPMLEGEDLDYSIPADESYRHFGIGQTETMLDLPPGRHTLQLLLGDANHVPHNPPVASAPISITVSE